MIRYFNIHIRQTVRTSSRDYTKKYHHWERTLDMEEKKKLSGRSYMRVGSILLMKLEKFSQLSLIVLRVPSSNPQALSQPPGQPRQSPGRGSQPWQCLQSPALKVSPVSEHLSLSVVENENTILYMEHGSVAIHFH